jgi:hypothetical protein
LLDIGQDRRPSHIRDPRQLDARSRDEAAAIARNAGVILK